MSESSVPSTQIVPAQYDRTAWNMRHGTQLEAHNDELTPEQAQLINDNYDIVIHGGGHGKFKEGTPGQVFDADYDAAAGVVEAMQPNDVLFVEGYGFKTPEEKPVLQSFPDMSPSQKRLLLEKMRENRMVNPWHYAIELAGFKGITVVNADIDAAQYEKAKELGFLDPDKNAEIGPDVHGKYINERIHAWRERMSRNIVKDWALAHLPPAQTPPLERKRGLHVLYGLIHLDQLKESFEERGLQVTTDRLNVQDYKSEAMKGLLALVSMAGALLMEREQPPEDQGKVGR